MTPCQSAGCGLSHRPQQPSCFARSSFPGFVNAEASRRISSKLTSKPNPVDAHASDSSSAPLISTSVCLLALQILTGFRPPDGFLPPRRLRLSRSQLLAASCRELRVLCGCEISRFLPAATFTVFPGRHMWLRGLPSVEERFIASCDV